MSKAPSAVSGRAPRHDRVIALLKKYELYDQADEAAMWARVSLADLISPGREGTPTNERARRGREQFCEMLHLSGWSWNVLSKVFDIDRTCINPAYRKKGKE